MKLSTLLIDVQAQDARWKTLLRPYRKTAEEACSLALRSAGAKKGEVTVVLADDAFVRALNRDFRGKDKPTNVLSFEGEGHHLGDIVLALETVKREAKEQGKTFRVHAQHLLVHGALHLLGFDHMKENEADEMEALEIKILKKLKVENPYL